MGRKRFVFATRPFKFMLLVLRISFLGAPHTTSPQFNACLAFAYKVHGCRAILCRLFDSVLLVVLHLRLQGRR
jgi:hypothetical protein